MAPKLRAGYKVSKVCTDGRVPGKAQLFDYLNVCNDTTETKAWG